MANFYINTSTIRPIMTDNKSIDDNQTSPMKIDEEEEESSFIDINATGESINEGSKHSSPNQLSMEGSTTSKETHSSQKNKTYFTDDELGTKRCFFINSLLSWSISFEFKRETFHLAVVLFDKSCAYYEYICDDMLFQLAVVSLAMAAKILEVNIPTANDYLEVVEKNINVKISLEDFFSTEKTISRVMQWRLQPKTIYVTLHEILFKWDEMFGTSGISFLNDNPLSYIHYRQIHQVIDTLVHHHQYVEFPYEHIVLSSMFILILRDIDYELFNESNKHKAIYDAETLKSCLNEVVHGQNENEEIRNFINNFNSFLIMNKVSFDELKDSLVFSSKLIEIKFYYFEPKEKGDNYHDYITWQTKIEHFSDIMKLLYNIYYI